MVPAHVVIGAMAFCLTGFCALASDQEFPIFNPNVFCKAVGAANPQYPTGSIEKACLYNEQQAYDEARSMWPDASRDAKSICFAMANKLPARNHAAYEVLSACLVNRAAQDRLSNQGAFKY